ncbi:MAG: formate dehydrogenase accessory sulfurtransferase FdhD [Candidatus Thorarchaeota archaeon]
MKNGVSEVDCIRVNGDNRETRRETIAVEAHMQLIVNGQHVTDFLYSPGWDEQLVVGFLVSSGLISNVGSIEKIEIENEYGKVTISNEEDNPTRLQNLGITVSHRQLIEIRDTLQENQQKHRASRGFHGAIIWELSTRRYFVCEDIGRHNAVDKVIGYALQKNYNPAQCMILLSGRLVSNIVSKGKNAGISLMASMTVATDRGIKQANDSEMTLVGSLSEEGFWLYNEGVVRVT